MLVGTLFVASGTLALLLVAAFLPLGAALFVVSVGSLLVYIAAPTFLASASTSRERPYLFGVAAAAYVVSTAVGAAVGGGLPVLLRLLFADRAAPEVYRASLLAGGMFSALAIPILAMTREKAANAAPADEVAILPNLRLFLKHVFDRRFQTLLAKLILADGLIRVGGNLFLPYLNVYFVNHLGASEAEYGLMRSGERALVVLATLLVAVLVTRFGPVTVVVVSQLVSVPLLLTVGFAGSLAIAVAAYVVRGPVMEMTQPTRDNFVVDVSPRDMRATALAALTLAGYGIGFGTSFLSQRLFEGGQFELSFSFAAALYVVSAALYWLFFRSYNRALPPEKMAAIT